MSAQRIEVDLASDGPEVIIRDMMTPYRAIDDFLDDCRRRGYSQRTLTTYKRLLEEFAERLPIDYDVSQISEDDTRRFLGSNRAKLAQGTIAHREAVVSSWLKWLYKNRKIKANPMDRLDRTRRIPAADLDVTTVSTADAWKMLEAAEGWTERLAIGVLLYMGPRRRAVARLRLRDYDRKNGKLRFQEKGGKTIWKPVPDELRPLLEGAIEDGAIAAGARFLNAAQAKKGPFLIPPEAFLSGSRVTEPDERDDRCIYDIVKRVAKRAGVESHVHALRAAFAVFFLETHGRDSVALQELLGHSSSETTKTYLRKMDKAAAMEQNRTLSWKAVAKEEVA